MSARFKISRKHGNGKVDPTPPRYPLLVRCSNALSRWHDTVAYGVNHKRSPTMSKKDWWASYCLKMDVWHDIKEKRK